jgi:hypothetical protein
MPTRHEGTARHDRACTQPSEPGRRERRLNLPARVSRRPWLGVAAADVDEAWGRLSQPTESPPGFDPAMTEPLPEPARRWLTHVIAPGTPVARAVIVEMRGHIRLGRWIPFGAVQLQAPPTGFIWAARVGWGPVWIGGYDRYCDASGEMRWRLFGRIKLMSAAGRDINRSTAGRVALDALLVPTAWLQETVTWRAGDNDNTVVAEWPVDDQTLLSRSPSARTVPFDR